MSNVRKCRSPRLDMPKRRWLDQAKRLKERERENDRLRKAVSALTLDKQILKEALTGNVWFSPSVQGA